MAKYIRYFTKTELVLWAASALAYAANDVVLIVLWAMAAAENATYFSVLVCFVMFLVNDLYGFLNWKQMEKRQLQTA